MNDKKESLEVRRRAASIVSIIGAENNAAVPELIEAVGDADAEIAWYAVVTIGKIALDLSLDYFYPQRCTEDDWFLLFLYTSAHFHPESFDQAFERHWLVVVARI